MTTAKNPESQLSAYFESYVEAGKPGGLRFTLRQPRATLAALRTLRSMPLVPFTVGRTTEGELVARAVLDRPGWGVLRSAVSVLRVPEDAAEYLEGSSKQTLRRKIRAAEKAGVTWRRIDDPAERRRLLARADAYERTNARETYRNESADNSHLLDVRLWIGAFDADNEPLMLSITPFDGDWAALSYFRTFSPNPAASDTRYLMSKVLVDHLAVLGVRAVADTVNPAHLQNGLRHFQRMVGFRIEHVDLSPSATAGSNSEPTPRSRSLVSSALPVGTAVPADSPREPHRTDAGVGAR